MLSTESQTWEYLGCFYKQANLMEVCFQLKDSIPVILIVFTYLDTTSNCYVSDSFYLFIYFFGQPADVNGRTLGRYKT